MKHTTFAYMLAISLCILLGCSQTHDTPIIPHPSRTLVYVTETEHGIYDVLGNPIASGSYYLFQKEHEMIIPIAQSVRIRIIDSQWDTVQLSRNKMTITGVVIPLDYEIIDCDAFLLPLLR